jgi:hypothetical protein
MIIAVVANKRYVCSKLIYFEFESKKKIKIRYINPLYFVTILAFFGLCFLLNNAKVLIGDTKHDELKLYANQFKNRYAKLKNKKNLM